LKMASEILTDAVDDRQLRADAKIIYNFAACIPHRSVVYLSVANNTGYWMDVGRHRHLAS
jgi:hypothetical protein